MSRALVVFESMFGNTAEVARAVARGLDGHVPTEVVVRGECAGRNSRGEGLRPVA